jgi:hypothetical protein
MGTVSLLIPPNFAINARAHIQSAIVAAGGRDKMSSSSPPRQFRAVIVGGGPVGLCLAHCLSHAGIDYVLLERRDTVVEESGFGLALWPHGVRVLDQLGLLEEGHEMCLLMKGKYNLWPDGSEIGHSDLYEAIEQK